MQNLTTRTIEQLVNAVYGGNGDLRERHLFTEALRGLVRLAKIEERTEMQRTAEKYVPATTGRCSRAEARNVLSAIKALS